MQKSYRFLKARGGTGSLLAGWSRHWLTDWLKGIPNFSVGPRRSLPPNLKSHGWAVSAAEHALGGWWVGYRTAGVAENAVIVPRGRRDVAWGVV